MMGQETTHRLYYYNKARGSIYVPCAKCLCGADLEDIDQIEEHMKEFVDA